MAAPTHFLRTLFFFGVLPSLWCVITYLHEGMARCSCTRIDLWNIPSVILDGGLLLWSHLTEEYDQGHRAVGAAGLCMLLGCALERRGASVTGWLGVFVVADFSIYASRSVDEAQTFSTPWSAFDGRVAAVECGRPAFLFASFMALVWRSTVLVWRSWGERLPRGAASRASSTQSAQRCASGRPVRKQAVFRLPGEPRSGLGGTGAERCERRDRGFDVRARSGTEHMQRRT